MLPSNDSFSLGMRAVGLGKYIRNHLHQSYQNPLTHISPRLDPHTAARCYELMLERTFQRQTFGKYLHEHGSCRELIADSASDLEAARLLTLACAEEIDRLGARGARDKIALIKVSVPEMTSRVVDRAVQVRCLSAFVCDCLVSFLPIQPILERSLVVLE